MQPYYRMCRDLYFYDQALTPLVDASVDRGAGQCRIRTSRSALTWSHSAAPRLTGVPYPPLDRVYCLGEQPITRRKAFPKALSDS